MNTLQFIPHDRRDDLVKLEQDSSLGSLPTETLQLLDRARRAGGAAFKESGFMDPAVPNCAYTDALIAAATANTILELARLGYLNIK